MIQGFDLFNKISQIRVDLYDFIFTYQHDLKLARGIAAPTT